MPPFQCSHVQGGRNDRRQTKPEPVSAAISTPRRGEEQASTSRRAECGCRHRAGGGSTTQVDTRRFRRKEQHAKSRRWLIAAAMRAAKCRTRSAAPNCYERRSRVQRSAAFHGGSILTLPQGRHPGRPRRRLPWRPPAPSMVRGRRTPPSMAASGCAAARPVAGNGTWLPTARQRRHYGAAPAFRGWRPVRGPRGAAAAEPSWQKNGRLPWRPPSPKAPGWGGNRLVPPPRPPLLSSLFQ